MQETVLHRPIAEDKVRSFCSCSTIKCLEYNLTKYLLLGLNYQRTDRVRELQLTEVGDAKIFMELILEDGM